MRTSVFACALFACALSLDLGAQGASEMGAKAVAGEEQDDSSLLTPLTQVQADQVRGEGFAGPASYSVQLASAFTAAQQFLAAFRAGCTTGSIVRDPNTLTWSFVGCLN